MKEIILLAQQELISPLRFYYLCQKNRCLIKKGKLYFLQENLTHLSKNYGELSYYLVFFDYLSTQIKKYPNKYITKFYLRKILLWYKSKIIKRLQVKKYVYYSQEYDLISFFL
ncbi:MAG: hypothetical protein GFH25_541266n35 [Chloroflexi bacterium AL-N10]|nr:hypothetical protein [Chloroflexi bacterium AL-N10]NOK92762.1 hypothetical protein [Chloroflexi bacterium AL-N15]